MGWVDLMTEQELVAAALSEAPEANNLQVEVSIPETIQEEREEDSLSLSHSLEQATLTLPSPETEAKGDTTPQKTPLRQQILRTLSSTSKGYSGLESNETNDPITSTEANSHSSSVTPAVPVPMRQSRFSRLLGKRETRPEGEGKGNFRTTKVKSALFSEHGSTSESNKSILPLEDNSETMAERFPGFKYRSQSIHMLTNETNLSLVDGEEREDGWGEREMDDIPPQQITPGRYTTLKQILGTEERGMYTSAPADTSMRDVKGIKGTRKEISGGAAVGATSARARERTPAGLGAVFGGILFDKLVVRQVEFTPRFLEMKLQEILPMLFTATTTGSPLHANRITPFHEIGSETQSAHPLSYDGHLALDGVDFSRDKHVEILLRILDLPIERSLELIKCWVTFSIEQATADGLLADHWEEFLTSNKNIFSQRVREAKLLQSEGKRGSPALGQDSLVASFPSSSSSKRPVERHRSLDSSSLDSSSLDSSSKGESLHIQHLDVRYCQMTNRGVTLLVDSLRKNHSLLSLNLSGNSISRDSTAASIGNMLNFNTSLVEVNLQETSLGNTGATLVAQSLHINRVRATICFSRSILTLLSLSVFLCLSVSVSVSLSL
jgi:hypothetical protein